MEHGFRRHAGGDSAVRLRERINGLRASETPTELNANGLHEGFFFMWMMDILVLPLSSFEFAKIFTSTDSCFDIWRRAVLSPKRLTTTAALPSLLL